jgi:hypothetical protein
VNQFPCGRVIGSHCGARELCSAKRKRLGDQRGRPYTEKTGEDSPPIGEELPMELTATITAIMAIMSFGFLAAVILGMI